MRTRKRLSLQNQASDQDFDDDEEGDGLLVKGPRRFYDVAMISRTSLQSLRMAEYGRTRVKSDDMVYVSLQSRIR